MRSNGLAQQRWTAEMARELLDEFSRSGVSLAQFARDKQISTQRIMYWRARLNDRSDAGFVHVALPGLAPSLRYLEVVDRGVVVRVCESIDVEHLAHIVDAIARRRQC